MQNLDSSLPSTASVSHSPSPVKRPVGQDENNDPSPKRVKYNFSTWHSSIDSLTNQPGSPRNLFATDKIPDSETSTTITDIADLLGITGPNIEFLKSLGVDVDSIDKNKLIAQAKQLKFSESELNELFTLPVGQILARVSLTDKLAQSNVPSHVLSAARTYREQGVVAQLSEMLKAQHNPHLSSLQGAERWRQLLALPDELFPFGWNLDEEESDRHIYLICYAITIGMNISDIKIAVEHNKLHKVIELITHPDNLGISPLHLNKLTETESLKEYVVNLLFYEMPQDSIDYGNPDVVCKQWRKAKLLGFSISTLLHCLKNSKLDLLIETGEKAHQAGVPISIFQIVTKSTELNDLLVLCSQGVKLNYSLITQICHSVPKVSLRRTVILCEQVHKKLDSTNTSPAQFDQLLLQYHRLSQYGIHPTDIEAIGDVAIDLLQFLEKRCFRRYEPAEINAIVYTLRNNTSLESLCLTLDIMAQEQWMVNALKTDNFHNHSLYFDILAFSSMMESHAITEKDKTLIKTLFLKGIRATVIQANILTPDNRTAIKDVTGFLEYLLQNATRLSDLSVLPTELVAIRSVQDLLTCLVRTEEAYDYIIRYSELWNVENNTWVLKQDPTITTSRLKLEKAIYTAFQIHKDVEVDGTDTVVKVNDDPNGGDKFVLRTRKNNISAMYISTQLLGQGTFGVVHKAVYENGLLLATKTARIGRVKNVYEEFLTLQAIHKDQQLITGLQPYPLALIWVGTPPNNLSFFSMVNELFSHSLWEEIYGHSDRYPEKLIDRMIPDRNDPHIAEEYLNVTTQLAKGLAYLHSKEFAHLDIKPANTLVDKPKRTVFHIDLGSAQSTIAKADDKPSFVGPTWWYAQEADVLERQRAFKTGEFELYKLTMEKMDVYGMGMSFHEFLTKTFPFQGLKKSTYPLPQNFNFNRPVFLANHVPDGLIDLVADMIQIDIKKRPSAAEVVERLKRIQSEILANTTS